MATLSLATARVTSAIALIVGAALAGLALVGPAADAHIGPGGVALTVLMARPLEEAPDRVELDLLVENYSTEPVDLRGLSSNKSRRIVIERRRTFLGFEFWRVVGSLRLQPGERVFLAPPDYRVIAETDAPETMATPELVLEGDFGPLGAIEAHLLLLP